MISCANGETILLTHDCTLPRPYSRGGRIQGTKGIWMEDNRSIYIDGRSPVDPGYWTHRWEKDEAYMEEYKHPLWQAYEEFGLRGGHGVFQTALAARLHIALGRVVHLRPVGGFHGRRARTHALFRRGLCRGRSHDGRGSLRGRSHLLSLTALLLVVQPLEFVKAHIRGRSPVFSCHL